MKPHEQVATTRAGSRDAGHDPGQSAYWIVVDGTDHRHRSRGVSTDRTGGG